MCSAWDTALHVIHLLNERGYNAYIVGGAVRDRLLSRTTQDIDIVTTAQAEEVESIFPKTYRLNNDYDTVIVRMNEQSIEVTTMRGASIEEDLKKRDLTINSIAQADQKFIDPTNGLNDIKERVLRSYDADERMTEDPLRMLRVYRFVSELAFSVDDKLKEVVKKRGLLLQQVAIERVTKEWLRLLKGKEKNKALYGLIETNLYSHFPIFKLTEQQLQAFITLPSLQKESDMFCWFLQCIHTNGLMNKTLKKLALSNETIRHINIRAHYYKMRESERWTAMMMYKATKEVAFDVEKARNYVGLLAQREEELEEMWHSLPIQSRQELAISGRDLIKLKDAGPWVKEALEWAEQAVITKKVKNNKTDLLEALERRERNC